MKDKNGVCLLEILAVLAIILILAAIGSTLREDFGTRKSVAQVRGDLSMIATALEAYAADSGAFPFDIDSRGFPWFVTDVLSTPVAYLSDTFLEDPFRAHIPSPREVRRYRYLNFPANAPPTGWPPSPYPGPFFTRFILPFQQSSIDTGMAVFGEWKLSSAGPDGGANTNFGSLELQYDPTNGTVSGGDIILSHRRRR